MSSVVVWTRQHCLVAFFGLAFALSWWVWPLYVLGLSPAPFLPVGRSWLRLLLSAWLRAGQATGRWVPG
jgi:hypothetical protein